MPFDCSTLINMSFLCNRLVECILNTMKKSSGYRKDLGNWGESFAAEWLEEKGYLLLKRNYHTACGEIDLIMRIDDEIVAVEVKTRKSDTYGMGESSVTQKKLRAIISSMELFLMDHPELPDSWQLDLLVIEPKSVGPPVIHHYENVTLQDANG